MPTTENEQMIERFEKIKITSDRIKKLRGVRADLKKNLNYSRMSCHQSNVLIKKLSEYAKHLKYVNKRILALASINREIWFTLADSDRDNYRKWIKTVKTASSEAEKN